MNEYTIYFRFYGKQMKTTVKAVNDLAAREVVKNKIEFIYSYYIPTKSK